MISLGCLEEALKYVLLLNFDEEPKYTYLIDELKKAYNNCLLESGRKPTNTCFNKPIFDWNVCLISYNNYLKGVFGIKASKRIMQD